MLATDIVTTAIFAKPTHTKLWRHCSGSAFHLSSWLITLSANKLIDPNRSMSTQTHHALPDTEIFVNPFPARNRTPSARPDFLYLWQSVWCGESWRQLFQCIVAKTNRVSGSPDRNRCAVNRFDNHCRTNVVANRPWHSRTDDFVRTARQLSAVKTLPARIAWTDQVSGLAEIDRQSKIRWLLHETWPLAGAASLLLIPSASRTEWHPYFSPSSKLFLGAYKNQYASWFSVLPRPRE